MIKKDYINHKRGAAIMTVVMFFVIIMLAMAGGLSSPVIREYKTARDFEKSKGAYYLSEAGSEDAMYRIKKAKPISTQEIVSLGGNTATTTITTVNSSQKSVSSVGDIITNTRRTISTLTTQSGESFNFGVQVGEGGMFLKNNSTITGSLFSAGPVCGGDSTESTCSGGNGTNLITGTVISGGTTGLNGRIARIQNQGGSAMYAGTIVGATIAGSAYCNTISGSSTSTCQTLTAQIAQPFSITATDIANYETAAAAGGAVTCSGGKYAISDDITIGPKKIPCNLEINGLGVGNGPVITLSGPIWVTGNIEMNKALTVRVDPTLTGQSLVMVADNPGDRITSSKIKTENNNTVFTGAPGGNSWVMLISENTSASSGGGEDAIKLENGAQGDLLVYARLGNILIQNNSSVRQVTGYKITLQDNANVIYAAGLENTLFTSGPGGTWTIQDWKEGQ
ncbi:MAG: hypothetical protein HZB10_00185 [Candidatus Yonathbacteria bacterium]|nr:hypothetical protein [Candidatus Yonathbacteria bacterium]